MRSHSIRIALDDESMRALRPQAAWLARASRALDSMIAEQPARAQPHAAPLVATYPEELLESWLWHALRDALPKVVLEIICEYAPLLVAQAFVAPPAVARSTTTGSSVPEHTTPSRSGFVQGVGNPPLSLHLLTATSPTAARVWCVPDPTTNRIEAFSVERNGINNLLVKRCVNRHAPAGPHLGCPLCCEWHAATLSAWAEVRQGFDGVAAVRGTSPEVPWLFMLHPSELRCWLSPSKEYQDGLANGEWIGVSALPAFPGQVGVTARLALAGRHAVEIWLVVQTTWQKLQADGAVEPLLRHQSYLTLDLTHQLGGLASRVVSMKSNPEHLFVVWATPWHVVQHWPDQALPLQELARDQPVTFHDALHRQMHTLCVYDAMSLELVAERHIGQGTSFQTAPFIALTPHAVLTFHPSGDLRAAAVVVRAFAILPPFQELETKPRQVKKKQKKMQQTANAADAKPEEDKQPTAQHEKAEGESARAGPHHSNDLQRRELARFQLMRVMNVVTCGDTDQTVVVVHSHAYSTTAATPSHFIEFHS